MDESTEPSNLKMARLRQCLTGNALEAIRGLGVTAPEYEEAKEILKSKYGGARRLLRAYTDHLEQMPLIRSNDIHALERFADLVRITVVKFESYSLRTVPVWMKANGREVKINAILDDASNETFLNEEVAGVLGVQFCQVSKRWSCRSFDWN